MHTKRKEKIYKLVPHHLRHTVILTAIFRTDSTRSFFENIFLGCGAIVVSIGANFVPAFVPLLLCILLSFAVAIFANYKYTKELYKLTPCLGSPLILSHTHKERVELVSNFFCPCLVGVEKTDEQKKF